MWAVFSHMIDEVRTYCSIAHSIYILPQLSDGLLIINVLCIDARPAGSATRCSGALSRTRSGGAEPRTWPRASPRCSWRRTTMRRKLGESRGPGDDVIHGCSIIHVCLSMLAYGVAF
jgi:hypothetical protein